eukprot:gene6991-15037_t
MALEVAAFESSRKDLTELKDIKNFMRELPKRQEQKRLLGVHMRISQEIKDEIRKESFERMMDAEQLIVVFRQPRSPRFWGQGCGRCSGAGLVEWQHPRPADGLSKLRGSPSPEAPLPVRHAISAPEPPLPFRAEREERRSRERGPRSRDGSAGRVAAGGAALRMGDAEGLWTCPACNNVNYKDRTTCNIRRCRAPRPQSPPPISPPRSGESSGGSAAAADLRYHTPPGRAKASQPAGTPSAVTSQVVLGQKWSQANLFASLGPGEPQPTGRLEYHSIERGEALSIQAEQWAWCRHAVSGPASMGELEDGGRALRLPLVPKPAPDGAAWVLAGGFGAAAPWASHMEFTTKLPNRPTEEKTRTWRVKGRVIAVCVPTMNRFALVCTGRFRVIPLDSGGEELPGSVEVDRADNI